MRSHPTTHCRSTRFHALRALAGAALVGLLAQGATAATPGAYTDAAAFAANVPTGVAIVDFESLADGTVLSGSTQTPAGATDGVVLPGPVPDVLAPGQFLDLRVVANGGDNPASSGSKSLGVVDPGNFNAAAAGTSVAFGFTNPVAAFGVTLISPEEPTAALFDGDARLSVPGEFTATLSLAGGQVLGTFNGREYRSYFLGVVGANAFASATLEYDAATPASGFFYNLDDLTVPIPEPGAPAMLAWGCALLLGMARRRARRETREDLP